MSKYLKSHIFTKTVFSPSNTSKGPSLELGYFWGENVVTTSLHVHS